MLTAALFQKRIGSRPFSSVQGGFVCRTPPHLWAFNGAKPFIQLLLKRPGASPGSHFLKQEVGGGIVGEEKEGMVSSSCAQQWANN